MPLKGNEIRAVQRAVEMYERTQTITDCFEQRKLDLYRLKTYVKILARSGVLLFGTLRKLILHKFAPS